MMNEELRKLQLTQLEILKVIDAFCRDHKIRYSLYAGTLLGAIRHKGFIPWDDDLDICMTRHEYNRFIKLWIQGGTEGYQIQNKELDSRFTQSFTKIRKDCTTFLQYESERGRYHTGIFVDVFPIDRIPDSRWRRGIFRLDCLFYQLYTREFVPSMAGRLTKLATAFFLKTSNARTRKKRRKRHFNRIVRYNRDKSCSMIAIETAGTLSQIFPADLMNTYIELPFEDMTCMCIKEWDVYLKVKFGDYMKLPPEVEREWKHHPLVLDFGRSIEPNL